MCSISIQKLWIFSVSKQHCGYAAYTSNTVDMKRIQTKLWICSVSKQHCGYAAYPDNTVDMQHIQTTLWISSISKMRFERMAGMLLNMKIYCYVTPW